MPDIYTKVLLHSNGVDGGAIVDEIGHSFSVHDSAALVTAEKQFGSASLRLDQDGVESAIYTAQHADFNLGPKEMGWGVDFWIRYASLPGSGFSRTFVSQHNIVDGIENWRMYLQCTSGIYSLRYVARDLVGNPLVTVNKNIATPNFLQWYHIAITAEPILNNRAFRWFIDGIQQSTEVQDDSTIVDSNGPLWIGGDIAETWRGVDAWMDEFRLSVGSYRWNANFVPPTEEYNGTPVGPTMAQLMRQRKWFNNGIFQGYYLG